MSPNVLRVLVVEDDEPKLRALREFLRAEARVTAAEEARSLSTAIAALSRSAFDLAVVDMSLPTYDVSMDRSGGGQPQGFGGEDVLRFIECEQATCKSVVLTQYEEFPGNNGNRESLVDVRRQLKNEFGERLLDVVYYSGPSGEWRQRLAELIDHLADDPDRD